MCKDVEHLEGPTEQLQEYRPETDYSDKWCALHVIQIFHCHI